MSLSKRLKRMGLFLILMIAFTAGYSITTDEIRDIMNKPAATVEDALYLLSSIDNPDLQKSDINLGENDRLKALNPQDSLNAGRFSIIAIEMKKVKGGIIYNLTGLSKYAAESLVYRKIFPDGFSWNREISGYELIEFISTIKEKQK